jgi:hypothetical protein
VSKLVTRFAVSGDQVIQAKINFNLLSVYAVKRSSGGLSLLVINKSRASGLNASINLAGFTPQSAGAIHSYGIAQDEAARTGTGSPDLATGTLAGAARHSLTVFPLTRRRSFLLLPQWSALRQSRLTTSSSPLQATAEAAQSAQGADAIGQLRPITIG